MKTRIGIVGGGQLARMLTIAAKQMGFTVTVIDPTPHSPAGQVADKQITASLNDEKGMLELAKHADFVTIEWELANPQLLEKIVKKGIPVNPSVKTLNIIKDKYQQKFFLQNAHIPVAKFMEISSCHAEFISASNKTKADILKQVQDDIQKAAKIFGYPLLLKTKVGAYDGRGNYLIKNRLKIKEGLEKLGVLKGKEVYVEQFVPFEKELAIMVARNTKGDIETYPVVQTIHKNNILHFTLAPAPVNNTIVKKAELLARKTMKHLKGAGVFGIEMFLTKDNKVLINEIAPRVHNSGHYTIEHCVTSQFEQHIRAITDLPLGKTTMLTPVAVMGNLLGKRTGSAEIKGLEKVLHISGVSVHIYGKKETRVERKMGHITVIGDSLEECLKKAKTAQKYLFI